MLCPRCEGEKRGFGFAMHKDGQCSIEPIQCYLCNGTAEVTAADAKNYKLGVSYRQDRIKSGESLRDVAARHGLTVLEVADIERGKRPAPDSWAGERPKGAA